MKRNLARAMLILMVAAAATLSAAPSQHVLRVREWRAAHERQILDELMRLVSLPNIASNQADIARNADLLTAMFEKRGFNVQRITTPGSPLLVARRDAPKAVGTLIFYMHAHRNTAGTTGISPGTAPFICRRAAIELSCAATLRRPPPTSCGSSGSAGWGPRMNCCWIGSRSSPWSRSTVCPNRTSGTRR